MTISAARFKNFTAVPSDEFRFASGVNVIVGENGTGKSHVLKAIYSLLRVQSTRSISTTSLREVPAQTVLEKEIAERLVRNFRPEYLGRLVKRRQGRGRAELDLKFSNSKLNLRVSFASNARSQVEINKSHSVLLAKQPVFLPTRELITLSGWFPSLYDNFNVEFEETWRDTVSLLNAPTVRGPKELRVRDLLAPIESAIGGRVEVDTKTAKFYLRTSGGRMEMPLVAEGVRKFAMLARLISTGVLLEHGYLFWDEPETNLNPKLVRLCAQIILALAGGGIQIFIATHSLFLLKELQLLTRDSEIEEVKFFSIAAPDDHENLLDQASDLADLEPIVSLDEEIAQADRYLRE